MRLVIAGAGAIGAYVGARMTRAGQDVTLIARGPHLRAMRERGLRIESAEGGFEVQPRLAADIASAGQADVVFLAVKAHSLPGLAPQLAPLLGPDTVVISMQNGIPWWYFPEMRLETVDPGGVVSAAIERRRVLGSIVYVAAELAEPGVVRHVEGNRISLGEPDGARSERARAIAAELGKAGLRCPVTTHLHGEIWTKLLGNASLNPLSTLTRGTIAGMLRHPEVSAVARAIMEEIQCVAAHLEIELPITIDQRIAGAEKVGEHKTSMLQDLEAGRPLELEPIVGAVLEVGRRLGVPMPRTETVYACAKLLESNRRA